jgi:hypothetical protein
MAREAGHGRLDGASVEDEPVEGSLVGGVPVEDGPVEGVQAEGVQAEDVQAEDVPAVGGLVVLGLAERVRLVDALAVAAEVVPAAYGPADDSAVGVAVFASMVAYLAEIADLLAPCAVEGEHLGGREASVVRSAHGSTGGDGNSHKHYYLSSPQQQY